MLVDGGVRLPDGARALRERLRAKSAVRSTATGRALTLHSIQIAREIDAFATRYRNLRPSMYIVCERTAYAPVPGADADGLRITFDSGVAYRDVLAGERGAGSTFHPLLGLDEMIMEVKTAGAYPSWLVEVLGGCQAYPSSFSKYGVAYQECERAAGVRFVRDAFPSLTSRKDDRCA